MRTTRVVVGLLALLLVAAPVIAHVPTFPADNTTPERAVAVPDAAKSWSFYDHLGEGEVAYYRLSLAAGERLVVGTFTPASGEFTPSIVVMSPGLASDGTVPAHVTVPEGMGAVVVAGDRPPAADYEPFAPSANYRTAGIERPVETETTVLVAVYEPTDRSGPVGVSVGYEESFTLEEYLTVPFDLVRVHWWAGQSPLTVAGPFLLTAVVGAALGLRRRRRGWQPTPGRLVVGVAGLAVVASGANTAVQMGLALARTGFEPAALLTAAFVLVPAACGGWAVRFALRSDPVTPRRRAGLLVAGAASLVAWAGFVLAPVVLLAAAVALPGPRDG